MVRSRRNKAIERAVSQTQHTAKPPQMLAEEAVHGLLPIINNFILTLNDDKVNRRTSYRTVSPLPQIRRSKYKQRPRYSLIDFELPEIEDSFVMPRRERWENYELELDKLGISPATFQFGVPDLHKADEFIRQVHQYIADETERDAEKFKDSQMSYKRFMQASQRLGMFRMAEETGRLNWLITEVWNEAYDRDVDYMMRLFRRDESEMLEADIDVYIEASMDRFIEAPDETPEERRAYIYRQMRDKYDTDTGL